MAANPDKRPCFVSGPIDVNAIKNCGQRVLTSGKSLDVPVYLCTHPDAQKVEDGSCPLPPVDKLVNILKK